VAFVPAAGFGSPLDGPGLRRATSPERRRPVTAQLVGGDEVGATPNVVAIVASRVDSADAAAAIG
jgi:hypothetical protein